MTFLGVALAIGPSARSNTALHDCDRSSDSQRTTPLLLCQSMGFPAASALRLQPESSSPGAHDVAALRAPGQHASQEQFHIE